LSGHEDYVYLGINTDDIPVSEISIQKFPEAEKLTPFVQATLDLMYLKTESEDQSLKDKLLSSLNLPAVISFLFVLFKQYIQASSKFVVYVL
jgi:hypothetical protein